MRRNERLASCGAIHGTFFIARVTHFYVLCTSESFNVGRRGCPNFVPEFGGGGGHTKKSPTGDRFDQPPGAIS